MKEFSNIEEMYNLRNYCTRLMHDANDEQALKAIKGIIIQSPDSFINVVHVHVLASVYGILKKITEDKKSFKNSYKQLLVETLSELFQKFKLDKKGVFFNIYSFLLFEVYDHQKHLELDYHDGNDIENVLKSLLNGDLLKLDEPLNEVSLPETQVGTRNIYTPSEEVELHDSKNVSDNVKLRADVPEVTNLVQILLQTYNEYSKGDSANIRTPKVTAGINDLWENINTSNDSDIKPPNIAENPKDINSVDSLIETSLKYKQDGTDLIPSVRLRADVPEVTNLVQTLLKTYKDYSTVDSENIPTPNLTVDELEPGEIVDDVVHSNDLTQEKNDDPKIEDLRIRLMKTADGRINSVGNPQEKLSQVLGWLAYANNRSQNKLQINADTNVKEVSDDIINNTWYNQGTINPKFQKRLVFDNHWPNKMTQSTDGSNFNERKISNLGRNTIFNRMDSKEFEYAQSSLPIVHTITGNEPQNIDTVARKRNREVGDDVSEDNLKNAGKRSRGSDSAVTEMNIQQSNDGNSEVLLDLSQTKGVQDYLQLERTRLDYKTLRKELNEKICSSVNCWVEECTKKRIRVNKHLIMSEAFIIYKELRKDNCYSMVNFAPSKSWFKEYMQKFNKTVKKNFNLTKFNRKPLSEF